MADVPPELRRYSRQILFAEIGEATQRRLAGAHVTLIGCGALGTVLASTLVRAGVGHLRICDRDFVETDNLQRQVLFDEDDVRRGLPKAEAARRKLAHINSDVTVEAHVTHVDPSNLATLVSDADLLLDGSDNFETRFLINDWSVKTGTPWIYGGVLGGAGLCMVVIPGSTPCLRCLFAEAPPPELNPTCDTAGVIGPAVNVIASLQSVEAMKILGGRIDAVTRGLMSVDVWGGRWINLNVESSQTRGGCPCCGHRRFDYLEGNAFGGTTVLCGRNAVQISRSVSQSVELAALARKLRHISDGDVQENAFLVKAHVGDYIFTVFRDGRAIITGTRDTAHARSLYDRYIGS